MPEIPDVKSLELEDQYYHITFNDPDRFEKIRTPDWAENIADSISEGSEVRMGKEKDGDDWEVESVLIPKENNEEDARRYARKIVEKIEN